MADKLEVSEDETEEVALTYKNLWQVEYTFKSLKSILQNRPISRPRLRAYHQTPENIKGHMRMHSYEYFVATYLYYC